MAELGFKIVVAYVDGKANFLDFDYLLVFLCFLVSLLLLKAILPVIHYFAYGGSRLGSDFHKVEALFDGKLKSRRGRHDAKLASVVAHDSYFTVANLLVDSVVCCSYLDAPP
jgi:hypothetical protein